MMEGVRQFSPALPGTAEHQMILQSTDRLEEYIGNKYSLVIVAAKRARQLKEGHPALARDSSPNVLSLALKEIEDEKVQAVAPPEEELPPAPREVIASLVAGAGFDLDEELDLEDSDAVDDLAALLVGADEDEEEEEAEGDDALAAPAEADAESEEESDEEETEEEETEEEETEEESEEEEPLGGADDDDEE
jgi:DNA-directed RNA polymerase subunit omega